ncbi:MAG: YceI family protein [Phycisphaerales bacterium JB052]
MKRTTKAITAAALLAAGATLAGFGLNTNSSGALETMGVESTAAIAENLAAKVYTVDPVHSSILFKLRHGGLSSFYGHFDAFSGTVRIDPDNITDAKFNITVKTDSVDTNNTKRDDHVKNADFFNARQYPEAKFTSTAITEQSDGVYQLKGDFSFHGQTHPVTATLTEVSFGQSQGKDAMGFHAVFSIKRSEFGIVKYVDSDNPESGPLGDSVQIIVSLEAVNR